MLFSGRGVPQQFILIPACFEFFDSVNDPTIKPIVTLETVVSQIVTQRGIQESITPD